MPTTQSPVEPLNRPTLTPLSRAVKNLERKKIEKKFAPLQALKIVYVPTDSLYPNEYNPNRQTEREFDLLLKSITEDGFTTPVVVQHKTNQIVDGEHRWRAATRLGMAEIPIVYVDMTAQEMRVATLRHNRARGSEDIELTIKILQDLRSLGALDHAVDSLGMNKKDLDILIDDLPAPEQMAGKEFSAAWVPSNAAPTPETEYRKGEEVHTSAAVLVQKKAGMENLANATSFTQMGDMQKANNFTYVPLSVTLPIEEAAIVQRILGVEEPAKRVLKICLLEIESDTTLLEKYMNAGDGRGYESQIIKVFQNVLGRVPEYLLGKI